MHTTRHTPLDASALGATLYVPATRDDLLAIVTGGKYPYLRSAVLCLEDAVHPHDLPLALYNIRRLFAHLEADPGIRAPGPVLFVRPRDTATLGQIMSFAGAAHIDGIVIPKATADVVPAYVAVMPYEHHHIMPTIETQEAFDPWELRRLREQLIILQQRVLAIRIGGNDLLKLVGVRRSLTRTAYDGPLGAIIASLVTAFRPWGFAMSAPVFEGLSQTELLCEEIERDIEHGLLTKTAIHPSQVELIHDAYRVRSDELDVASSIVAEHAPAVFTMQGAMCEPSTHRVWADSILQRARHYGVIAATAKGARPAADILVRLANSNANTNANTGDRLVSLD